MKCIVCIPLILTVLLILATSMTYADDQFLCCMKGVKRIRKIDICPAPCCPGYQELAVYTSKLSRIVYCDKIPLPKEKGLYCILKDGELCTAEQGRTFVSAVFLNM